MSTQLQAIGNFSADEVKTIQETLAVGTTPSQFSLFVRTAAAAGLNPFLNHIYCIVYGGKMSIQISVEGIMFLAKRVDGFAGVDVQLVYEGEEFKAKRVRGEDGKYYWDVEHEIGAGDSKVLGCYVFAYRTGFPDVFEYMKVKEVEHNLSGTNSALWKKYFNDMFKKQVLKRALKRQFGIEIAEDDENHNSPDQPYERKTINPEDVTEEPTKPATKTESKKKTDSPAEKPVVDEIAERKAVNAAIKTKLKDLGITTDEAIGAYMKENMQVAGEVPTLDERKALLTFIENEIAAKDDDLPE